MIQRSPSVPIRGIVLGAASLFIVGWLLYGPTGRDDVYKTLWPAKTFAASGTIQNYNGDALEQSSSLLHVVALGALHRLTGINLPDLNLGFIFCCGLITIMLTTALGRRLGLGNTADFPVLLGMQAAFIYWSMGGLDSVLAALCWVTYLLALEHFSRPGPIRAWSFVGLFLTTALVVTVRPESPMVGILGLGVATFRACIRPDVHHPRAWQRYLLAAAMVAGFTAALAAARIGCTGHWMPQPVLAKSGGLQWERTLDGLRYLYHESRRHPELIVLWAGMATAIWRMFRGRDLSHFEMAMHAIGLAGMAFVVASGGDWMENGRFLVPFLPILVIQVVLALEGVTNPWRKWLLWTWAGISLLGVLMVARSFNTGYSPLFPPRLDSFDIEAKLPYSERHNRIHLRDVEPLAALEKATEQVWVQKQAPVIILSQQAGMMAFHLAEHQFGRFRFIDLVGLCTSDFTDCSVTKGRGNFVGGLNMDLIYMLDDWERIHGTCGIPHPDVIFGLDEADGRLRRQVLPHGYKLYHLQEGIMPSGSGCFPGMEVDAGEFIVVDERYDLEAYSQ